MKLEEMNKALEEIKDLLKARTKGAKDKKKRAGRGHGDVRQLEYKDFIVPYQKPKEKKYRDNSADHKLHRELMRIDETYRKEYERNTKEKWINDYINDIVASGVDRDSINEEDVEDAWKKEQNLKSKNKKPYTAKDVFPTNEELYGRQAKKVKKNGYW